MGLTFEFVARRSEDPATAMLSMKEKLCLEVDPKKKRQPQKAASVSMQQQPQQSSNKNDHSTLQNSGILHCCLIAFVALRSTFWKWNQLDCFVVYCEDLCLTEIQYR
jgi:hypothetical protein